MKTIKSKIHQACFDIIVNCVAASILCPRALRTLLYQICGLNVKTLNISHGCYFGSSNVYIESGCFINIGFFCDGSAEVRIGKNTSLGMRVTIITSSHDYSSPTKRAGAAEAKGVLIGEGCWIGACATILPGAKIADGCVVGASSLVRKTCQPNKLHAGVPTKVIKDLALDSFGKSPSL